MEYKLPKLFMYSFFLTGSLFNCADAPCETNSNKMESSTRLHSPNVLLPVPSPSSLALSP